MRKFSGPVLILIGTFLVVVAVLSRFYTYGQVLKTPLNVNTTTRLSGTASFGTNTPFPIKVTSITRANSSMSDGKVVAFESSTCVVQDIDNPPNCVTNADPKKRLITASSDNFAEDRFTGLAVNDAKYVDASAGKHEGLINKFPFESKKKTYPFWDGTVGKAIPAKFVGEGHLLGLSVYMYKTVVTDAAVQIAQGVPGTYSNTTTYYADPLTGAIVNQVEQQVRTDSSGAPVLTLQAEFTKADQASSVHDAKSNDTKLHLIHNVVPLVAGILGLIVLGLGGFLTASRRRGDHAEA